MKPIPIKKSKGGILLAVAALLLLAGAAVGANGEFSIHPFVIGCGGGHSQAGNLTLDGTIGQAVVDMKKSEGIYELCSGFWCEIDQETDQYTIYLPLTIR